MDQKIEKNFFMKTTLRYFLDKLRSLIKDVSMQNFMVKIFFQGCKNAQCGIPKE